MKYCFLLASIVTALAEPWLVHSDLYVPSHLEKRGSGQLQHKMKMVGGKIETKKNPNSPGSNRPDTPPKPGDTTISVKAVGPGYLTTESEQDKNNEYPTYMAHLDAGYRATKNIHDSKWTLGQVKAEGRPPSGAAKQAWQMHPARIEGSGQHANLEIEPPPKGGYAQFKKEVNDKVVKEERVKPGQPIADHHEGKRPNEVKYTASSSRGGQVWLTTTNQPIHRKSDAGS